MQTSPFGSSHFSGLPLVRKQVICQPAPFSFSMKSLVVVLLRMLLEHCGYYLISFTGTSGDLLLHRVRKQLLLTSSHEHEKMAPPSLQGRRERTGEENS